MKRAAMLLLVAAGLGATAPPGPTGEVAIGITGLRSERGVVRICLTRDPVAFPQCRSDPAARRHSVPAADATTIRFEALPPGRYAVSLLHDENANGRADMMLMVPREGFGFSGNAAVRFGPPTFRKAAFAVSGQTVRVPIKVRYML